MVDFDIVVIGGGHAGIEAAHQITSDEKSVVLIHDGVRPLIEAKTITDCQRMIRS